MTVSVGIDVGKFTLDVAISGQARIQRLPNTPAGWSQLVALLTGPVPPCIVLEATGRYHEGVTAALAEAGTPATVANPMHTAAFRRSEGQLAKTDALDARGLQRFAEQKQPPPTPQPAPAQRAVRDLVRTRADLVETRVRTQLQAQAVSPTMRPHYQALLDLLTTQIAALDAAVAAAVAADPDLAARGALLASLPGVGPVLSASLLAQLPELGACDRRRIASLAGLAPRATASGTQRGHPVVWGGRAEVRRALYLVAANAVALRRTGRPAQGAGPIRDRYLALLARGKSVKCALIAIARWVVTILNVMVRDDLRWEQLRVAQDGAAA